MRARGPCPILPRALQRGCGIPPGWVLFPVLPTAPPGFLEPSISPCPQAQKQTDALPRRTLMQAAVLGFPRPPTNSEGHLCPGVGPPPALLSPSLQVVSQTRGTRPFPLFLTGFQAGLVLHFLFLDLMLLLLTAGMTSYSRAREQGPRGGLAETLCPPTRDSPGALSSLPGTAWPGWGSTNHC